MNVGSLPMLAAMRRASSRVRWFMTTDDCRYPRNRHARAPARWRPVNSPRWARTPANANAGGPSTDRPRARSDGFCIAPDAEAGQLHVSLLVSKEPSTMATLQKCLAAAAATLLLMIAPAALGQTGPIGFSRAQQPCGNYYGSAFGLDCDNTDSGSWGPNTCQYRTGPPCPASGAAPRRRR
jgi:hypothetical protein